MTRASPPYPPFSRARPPPPIIPCYAWTQGLFDPAAQQGDRVRRIRRACRRRRVARGPGEEGTLLERQHIDRRDLNPKLACNENRRDVVLLLPRGCHQMCKHLLAASRGEACTAWESRSTVGDVLRRGSSPAGCGLVRTTALWRSGRGRALTVLQVCSNPSYRTFNFRRARRSACRRGQRPAVYRPWRGGGEVLGLAFDPSGDPARAGRRHT